MIVRQLAHFWPCDRSVTALQASGPPKPLMLEENRKQQALVMRVLCVVCRKGVVKTTHLDFHFT